LKFLKFWWSKVFFLIILWKRKAEETEQERSYEIPSYSPWFHLKTRHHIIPIHWLLSSTSNVVSLLCVDYWIFQTSKNWRSSWSWQCRYSLSPSRASKNINYDSQGNKSNEHKSITDEAFIKIFSLVILNFLKKRHLTDTRQICLKNVYFVVFSSPNLYLHRIVNKKFPKNCGVFFFFFY
jgi:hypothetical protein